MFSIIPSSALFITTLLSGTIIALSSSQWIFVWSGMELNLLSFIPLITQGSSRQESEAALKYFLTQAVGSALLLLGGLSYNMFLSYYYITIFLIMASLALKMGAAPFHGWFPQVMASLSWPLCIILSTWQKIAPLGLLSSSSASTAHLYFGLLGIITGGLGGLNQSQLRPLLAYSSIGHLGWMLTLAFVNQPALLNYMLIYMIMTVSIMLFMWISNFSSRNISAITKLPLISSISVSLMLLSLGGMPPFLGFFPKWQAIQLLSEQAMFLLTTLMILGALINLFYYLNIAMMTFLISASLTKSSYNSSTLFTTFVLSSLTLSPLFWIIT